MRGLKCLGLSVVLLPSLLHAGQIFGSITSSGKGVANAPIAITCAGAVTKGATSGDGSYRINVPQQGQCTLTLPGYGARASAVVFSYPNPRQYDFELVGANGSYQLRKR
jgi:hypothetical protein